MKSKKRPELKIPEKDDFDYDNIPDWEEIGEEEAPKKAKVIMPDVGEDDDDLGGLLDGLDDDEEDADEDDEDDDWDWDDDENGDVLSPFGSRLLQLNELEDLEARFRLLLVALVIGVTLFCFTTSGTTVYPK